jgi:hypothetical protein
MQCIILSSGRVDDAYIITEEPDVRDRLTTKLQDIAMSEPEKEDDPIGNARRAIDHFNLPFELRMLEMGLDESCELLGVEVRGVVSEATQRMEALQLRVNHPEVRAPLSCCPAPLAPSILIMENTTRRGYRLNVCPTTGPRSRVGAYGAESTFLSRERH